MAKDRVFPDKPKNFSDAVIGLASPKDRLASYVLDCTLLLPLVQLFQAPVRRGILESYLFEEGASVSSFQLTNLVLFVVLFIAYYTIMIWWKGQTIGKMFFGVKVISYRGELRFIDCFARAVSIFFEFIFCGLPLTAIISHPMRRPIHDRVADTLVISENSPSGFPSRRERWQARFINAALLFVMGVSTAVYMSIRNDIEAPGLTASEKELCDHSTFHNSHDLEKLIEMNVVKKLTDECLFEKARDIVWKQGDTPLGIFAMSLAQSNDSEKSNAYLAKICEINENHHLCSLSQWLLSNEKEGQSPLAELVADLDEKKPYPFVTAIVAMNLAEQRNYEEAGRLLGKIKKPEELQPLVASLNFHVLLGQLKWEEALWVYKTHGSLSDKDFLYFLQKELADSQLSNKQQLQLIEHFYPQLRERSSGRQPASTGEVPSEIKDIYFLIEARL